MTTPALHTDLHQQKSPGSAAHLEEYEHEVRCGMCARAVSVDEDTFRFATEAIESGLDNPFRCEICAAEYDDLSYEG